MGRLLIVLAMLLLSVSVATAQTTSVRALRQVTTTSQGRSTVLITNTGWQPIYSQQVEVKQGDLLRLIGQTQLTVEGTPEVGQQLRLTVNGQTVGTQSVEVNTQPGSHHLPMVANGLYQATQDETLTVILEGSSFHSDGEFTVTVDNADNLTYGSLLIEHYRSYPDLAAAWADGALLLNDIHLAPAQTQEIWCQQPYTQEGMSTLILPVNHGDLLRPSAQAVAINSMGLEQFTGVVTSQTLPVSPYGGQNVDIDNPMAPMLIEGVERVDQDGQQTLQHVVYGAFGHGLTLQPDSARFEVAHFSNYGRELKGFGQEPIVTEALAGDGTMVEVYSQTVDLEEGDLLRLTGNLQFGQAEALFPSFVDCKLQLTVEGPSGTVSSFSQKSLTPLKQVLPLTCFLTARATSAGPYRIALKVSGRSDAGQVGIRLDKAQSQLQYLHFGMPR